MHFKGGYSQIQIQVIRYDVNEMDHDFRTKMVNGLETMVCEEQLSEYV